MKVEELEDKLRSETKLLDELKSNASKAKSHYDFSKERFIERFDEGSERQETIRQESLESAENDFNQATALYENQQKVVDGITSQIDTLKR